MLGIVSEGEGRGRAQGTWRDVSGNIRAHGTLLDTGLNSPVERND
jgi:hypothetical protein